MKIAIITPTYPPYSSGISRMAEEEVKILEEAGFDVTVFTPNYITPSSAKGGSAFGGNSPYFASQNRGRKWWLSLFCKAKTAGAPQGKIQRLKPLLKYGNAAFLPQLIFKLRGFDAVHLHYPFLGAASTVLLWKKFFGKHIPLIVTYHMDLKGKGIFKIIFYFYTKFITPFILRAASRIIVTTVDYASSSIFLKTFFDNRMPASRLVEIPPSVNTHKFQFDIKDKSLMKKLNIDENDKVAIFVGALDKAHYFKGLPTLLAAMELLFNRYQVSNSKLLIVGGGNLKEFYQKLVKNSPLLADKVIFAGKVPDSDLPKYYNLSDFLVLPSIDSSEAFGIVILEAFASLRPALVSNLPGMRAVVEIGKTGLLSAPGDVNALADNLKKMFTEVPLHEWGRHGRYEAETKYSRDIVGHKLVALFKYYAIKPDKI